MCIKKKLRECDFFLTEMRKLETQAFGDHEPFDFYLSAFLNAARTVDYRLSHEHSDYRAWRKVWDEQISPEQNALLKFLIDDRNIEVHESGSIRIEKSESISAGNSYSDRSGALLVSGPPGMTGVQLHRPAYLFTINSKPRKVTDACDEYLVILKKAVADFETRSPLE